MNRLANVLVLAGAVLISGAGLYYWFLVAHGYDEFGNVVLGIYVSIWLVGIGAAGVAVGVFVRLLPDRASKGFEVKLTTGKTPVLLIKEANHG